MIDAFKFLRRVRQNVTSSSPDYRIATINTYAPGVGVSVTFDGESADSGQKFPVLGTYYPIVGQRAMMQKVGNTYVVMGGVGLSSDYQIAVKTNNQTFGSAVFDDVTGLTLETVAGAQYKFEMWLGIISPSTFNLIPALIMPTNATLDFGYITPQPGTTSYDTNIVRMVYRRNQTSGINETSGGNDLGVDTPTVWKGILTTSTNGGTVKVQGKSNSAAGLPWILEGSYIELTRIT